MTLQALAVAVLTFLVIFSALMILYATFVYRELAAAKREVDRSFSNLDQLLQERFEALGGLMRICGVYMQRDSRELRHLAEIRLVWAIAADKEGKLKSAADSYPALKNLIAAAEANPVLQSTEHFSRSKKRLCSIDDQVAEQREQYNSTITRFNIRLQQFPIRWLAGVTGFTDQPYFTAPVEERRSTLAATEDPPNQQSRN